MILTQLHRNDEDGSYNSTWKLTQEQVQVLLNVAIQIMVAKGLATVIDEYTDEEGNKIDDGLLDSLNKDDLPRA